MTSPWRSLGARRAILCAVLSVEALGDDPRAFAEALYRGGVDWIQLRDREVEDSVLFASAAALVAARDEVMQASQGSALRVIVNKRGDVAAAASADGLQLGFDALSAESIRDGLADFLKDDAFLGRSLHSLAEVSEAARAGGADYAQLAPIWDPRSKPASRPPLGLSTLTEACRLGLPTFAQGGLDPERAKEAIGAGACGICVSGGITAGGDLQATLFDFRPNLDLQS